MTQLNNDNNINSTTTHYTNTNTTVVHNNNTQLPIDQRSHNYIQPLQPIYCELHIHLDGAIRCTTLYELAQQRNIQLPSDVHQPHDLLHYVTCSPTCTTLFDFLQTFYILYPIISGDTDILERIAYEFVIDQYNSHIYYTEVRYSPHLLTDNILTCQQVIDAINNGLQRGMNETGIIVYSILCCIRDKPDWSSEIVDLAYKYKNNNVVGIDIASNEILPTEPHIDAFNKAHHLGLNITAHAGEVNDSSRVLEAIDILHAKRIGHGYACINDQNVYNIIKQRNIHIETCFTSSIHTGAVKQYMNKLTQTQRNELIDDTAHINHSHCPINTNIIKWHPIQYFIQDNINISLNTDGMLYKH